MSTRNASTISPDRPPALEDWFAADYIHGGRFVALADIRIDVDSGPIPAGIAEDGRILYCHTDRVLELFHAIRARTRPESWAFPVILTLTF